MFDEVIIDNTIDYTIDNQIDMRTDFECETCGGQLDRDYDNSLFCTRCGATYSMTTQILFRREVN